MISGYICIRDGDRLDYCWREAVTSLLPVCDEVVICDSDSTDGTREAAAEWELRDPRVRVIDRTWPRPCGDSNFWVDWMNYTRAHLRHETQLQLDGDEVLDPSGYEAILRISAAGGAALFTRLNYWGDPHHLIPRGAVCGIDVARLGPTALYMAEQGLEAPGNYPTVHPNVLEAARSQPREPSLVIHHLGFLREHRAFARKSEIFETAMKGSWNPKIRAAVETHGDWRGVDYLNGIATEPYAGGHPPIVREWLVARGYPIDGQTP